MKSKKGAGTVVAWVLLLGFSISLATTVFLWTTRQAEEMTESTVRFVEGGMQCDNVGINVAVKAATDCTPQKSCCLKITNVRYLNIEKIILRALERVDSAECGSLAATQPPPFIFCGQDWAPQNVSVMPVVKVNNDLVGCKNKAVTVKC